jgi:rare lipoprotein A
MLIAACATAPSPGPPVNVAGWIEEGLASWYGHPYHGRTTASGETYDMHSMTAAHRTLPFGTVIRVTRRDTGSECSVVINDRGPFVAGRIVDLSRAAAEALDAIGPGVVPVRLHVERPGDGMVGGRCWEVQVGAFGSTANADQAVRRLSELGFSSRRAPASGNLTRVRIVGLDGLERAKAVAREIRRDFPDAVPVPCGG